MMVEETTMKIDIEMIDIGTVESMVILTETRIGIGIGIGKTKKDTHLIEMEIGNQVFVGQRILMRIERIADTLVTNQERKMKGGRGRVSKDLQRKMSIGDQISEMNDAQNLFGGIG